MVPNRVAQSQANRYQRLYGTDRTPLDTDRAMRIADAYEALQHNPLDPDTATAYWAFVDETLSQFTFLIGVGVRFEPWTGEGQPYVDSRDLSESYRREGVLRVFTGGTLPYDHPLAAPVPSDLGLHWRLFPNVNVVFRAVHDYFGHIAEGNQFGPVGEEHAFQAHSRLYSWRARRALTTETRGQNSWVNFGRHLRLADGTIPTHAAQPGFVPLSKRPYAEQKAGLLPVEFSYV